MILEWCLKDQHWPEAQCRHNILNHALRTATEYSSFDLQSIMLYGLPGSVFTNKVGTPENIILSSLDKYAVETIYRRYGRFKPEMLHGPGLYYDVVENVLQIATPVADSQDCWMQCVVNPSCLSLRYTSDNQCRLYAQTSTVRSAVELESPPSYIWTFTDSEALSMMVPEAYYLDQGNRNGDVISTIATSSAKNCIRACIREPKCGGLTFNGAACLLTREGYQVVENRGSTDNAWVKRGYEYLGCYQETTDRVMPVLMGNVGTIAECISNCKTQGYPFAGLQFYGQCWCGNNYDKYGRQDAVCNTACPSGERCGGGYTNSVYRTSLVDNVAQKCNRISAVYGINPWITGGTFARYPSGGDWELDFCNCHVAAAKYNVVPFQSFGTLSGTLLNNYIGEGCDCKVLATKTDEASRTLYRAKCSPAKVDIAEQCVRTAFLWNVSPFVPDANWNALGVTKQTWWNKNHCNCFVLSHTKKVLPFRTMGQVAGAQATGWTQEQCDCIVLKGYQRDLDSAKYLPRCP
ncbi:hypothetical protein HDU86_001930 [Geranomyces michiganensis]|nr:hypothetical protein HDU86_001930 [Geranomyces michiganensis]